MWTLFTQALAKGNSTTQVSIMNTSTNFMITALLGFAIFSESLPPLWWLGAALLVAGNVIIGRKDEGGSTGDAGTDVSEQEETAERGALLPEEKSDDEDEDVPLLGDLDGPLGR
jgi:drug/metabolite transporter (DMT)-like permease